MTGVRVPHPSVVLHAGGIALACGLDGAVVADERHGMFAADTRVLSTYRLAIGGHAWRLLGRSRTDPATASWTYENPAIRDPVGDLPGGTVLLTVRRRLAGALHDDLRVSAFAGRRVHVRLTLAIDADFADIFEVRAATIPPRLAARRLASGNGFVLAFEHAGFQRGLHVHFTGDAVGVTAVGALTTFDLRLDAGEEWRCCVELAPEIQGRVVGFSGDPHEPEPAPAGSPGVDVRCAPLLAEPCARGVADLRALAVPGPDGTAYVAAGVPWFLTLFGRDSLTTALLAGVGGDWLARGALAATGALQATARDDWRDAEPGKLPHEMRHGELAFRHLIPHTPYYGTHDAPALYCLTLWQAWRWTGDRGLLAAHLDVARAALAWCEELGDRDGDGLLEYETRSPRGYYNQSWKDAGDAIVHADGTQAPTPLATVELQAYLFAARVAMAELLAETGDDAGAARLERAAHALRALVEERFWMDGPGFYALALDGAKRVVASIASNAGHVLWTGLAAAERAARVAERLLAPDMFSGWGLRTLSTTNPGYNPLSYQRGSVWPHDTVLAAAGLWRYGLRAPAARLLRAVLDAADAFEGARLPELFCGLDRDDGLPVPYAGANVPQAWAAAVPVLAVQLFLGLVPDAPRGRCFLSPWLPDWLPRLEVRGVAVGRGRFDVTLAGDGGETVVERLHEDGVTVERGSVAAPLWGLPPGQSPLASRGSSAGSSPAPHARS